jgi:ParB family chromosome partitioning protein
LEKKKKAVTSLPREYQQIQDRLVSHFSTKVALNKNPDGKGQIVIHFKNEDDLNRLLELMD